MLARTLRRNPGRVRAIFYAVLVHAVVIGFLVIGFRWTVQAPSDQTVVQAVVVQESPARKSDEADKRAQQEEEARKQAEAEKRHQDELKKRQEEEQQRQEVERKKKEAAEKEKQKEKEKQRRAAELERQKEGKRRQKLAEQSLQEQLAAEEKVRQDAARTAHAATVVDKYKALIRQRVSRSWSRPVGTTTKGLKCVVRVRLTPSGEVLAATVVRSSGDPLFDRSVENAVYKAAPLPLPEDPTLFDNFREIEFTFNPEE